MCENCNRRVFLGATAATGALWASASLRSALADGEPVSSLPAKVRIAAVFTGKPVPCDRSWGLCEEEIAAITQRFKQIEQKLGNVEFVVGRSNSADETAAILKQAGDDAPVLAINLSIGGLLRAATPVLEANRPMLVFSVPASGHDWMYPYRWRGEGKPVTLMTSSNLDELERAARLLRVVPLMRHSRILVFLPMQGTTAACSPEEIKKRLGSQVVVVPQERFDRLLEAVDEDKAKVEAEAWAKGAKQIVEPNAEDILKAARVSLALNRLMEEEKAQSLAVGTCMGWLSRGFPCLGFSRLRDRGLPASCEGDMDSLLTMMLFGYAFDIPGFQGNATFDTAKSALWTAHCVGPLRMDGFDAEPAPYLLRSHSEIGGGAVPEIQYRIGQKVTRSKLVNLDTLLVSTATIREVPEKSVRACRTQIVTEIADAAKMARNWGGGVLEGGMMTLLHRVVFYGDHLQDARHLADLFALRVVEEG